MFSYEESHRLIFLLKLGEQLQGINLFSKFQKILEFASNKKYRRKNERIREIRKPIVHY